MNKTNLEKMSPESNKKFIDETLKHIDKFKIELDKSSVLKLKEFLNKKHKDLNGIIKNVQVKFREKKHLSMLIEFDLYVEFFTNSFGYDEPKSEELKIWGDFSSLVDMVLFVKIVGDLE